MNILLATNNKHKLKELQQIFKKEFDDSIKLLMPSDLELFDLEIEEIGSTLEENALIKAIQFYKLTCLPCLADDTGLEIDALDGLPGVISARFAGVHGDDGENRRKVLELMSDIPEENRSCRFRTVLCFKNTDKEVFLEGICKGKINFAERGSNGFGYDSIFIPDNFDKTFAELSEEEKNGISHRSNAVRELIIYLKNQFQTMGGL